MFPGIWESDNLAICQSEDLSWVLGETTADMAAGTKAPEAKLRNILAKEILYSMNSYIVVHSKS